MKKIDHLDIDGHSLRLFLAVLEEGSVTAAAHQLGLTQSAVSHNLQKLRSIVRDPLFVKAGRGIVPTPHAKDLAAQALKMIEDMQGFASGAAFDPASAELNLTIAANDFQRDLLLPRLFARLSQAVKRVSLRALPSELPQADVLRAGRCDLLISPLPPEGIDIMQKRLLRDHYICYYDPQMRAAPTSPDDYLSARHITVVYTDNEKLNFDKRLEAHGLMRDIAISVPSFSGVPPFLAGSQMLASMPSLLAGDLMRAFAATPIPLGSPPIGSPAIDGQTMDGIDDLPMFMAWHRRAHRDPAHSFVRRLVEETAVDALRAAKGARRN
jgi:DNA-binding transcriptional LysR family regulator